MASGGPQDARLKKLLTAFSVQGHWPKLEQRGVRNVFALRKLSDQELVSLLSLNPTQLRKMRAVLAKLEAARAQNRQSQEVARKSSNPFAQPSQTSQQGAGQRAKRQSGTGSHQGASNRGSRVLNLAPAPGFSGPIDGALHRVPSRTQQNPRPKSSQRASGQQRSSRSSYSVAGAQQGLPPPASSSSMATARPPVSKKPQSQNTQPQRTRRSLWDFDFDVDVLPALVFQCWATKCGGRVRSWQRRYFSLRSDGSLTYSKDGALSEHKGVIDVRDATVINGPGKCNWLKEDVAPAAAHPMTRVEIVTPQRTYKLFCDTEEDAQALSTKLQEVWKYCRRVKKRPQPTEKSISAGEGYQRMLAEVAHVMTAQ